MGAEVERIEQHIFRYVEKELYRYKVNKSLVDSWDEESKTIYDESSHSIDQASDRRPQNKISNQVESKVMRLMSMSQKVDRCRWYCRAIEDVLDTLSADDRRLVELKYFGGMLTSEGVALEMNISRSEFYRRRHNLVEKFGVRMGVL